MKLFEDRNNVEGEVHSFEHQKFLDAVQNNFFKQDDEFVGISVVPSLDLSLKHLLKNRITFLSVKDIPTLYFPNHIDTDQIGMDRVVSLFEAYSVFKTACCVIDSGTATTITVIDSQGVYQGGVLLPGFEMTLKAFHTFTEKIPKVELSTAENLLATDTQGAVCSGLYFGFSCMLKGLIESITQKFPACKVVGCGHGLEYVKAELAFDLFDPGLAIKGLKSLTKSI